MQHLRWQGEFAGILDHDDLLAPNALYEIALALEKDPRTGRCLYG